MSRITPAGDAPLWAHDLANQINRAIDAVPTRPRQFTVDTRPSAAAFTGHIIRVTNGDAGSPCLAVSDGNNWNRLVIGAAISKT